MKLLFSLLAVIFLGIYPVVADAGGMNKEKDIGDPYESRDPLKHVNKNIFAFDVGVDKTVMRPAARAYSNVPEWGKRHMKNILTNLDEPKNLVNGILQGKPDVAFPSFWRFFVNTTIGFGGANDVASGAGLKHQEQNFSKTLASYGVNNGNYLMLPLIGPSTERNTVGMVADWVLDPLGWVMPPIALAQVPADGIADREEKSALVDQLFYESMDPYSATRSAYLQNQEFKQ